MIVYLTIKFECEVCGICSTGHAKTVRQVNPEIIDEKLAAKMIASKIKE